MQKEDNIYNSYFIGCFFILRTLGCSCETPKVAQKPVEEKTEVVVSDDLIVNMLDSVHAFELPYDESGSMLFGRKIIYRNLSAAKSATMVIGKVKIKVCINREGIVKYAEVLQDSSTIKDIRPLKSYLRAASGYKFGTSPDASEYECGKMAFRIDNSRNRTLR